MLEAGDLVRVNVTRDSEHMDEELWKVILRADFVGLISEIFKNRQCPYAVLFEDAYEGDVTIFFSADDIEAY